MVFEGKTYTDEKTETLAALGHDYGEPDYEWSRDNTSVTATVVCSRDKSHVVTETVPTVYSVTREATCEAPGEGLYTATFENALFTAQTKPEEIPATGHAYELTKWTWEGYTAATATFTCANDGGHVQTAAAGIDSVRTEASCEEAGSVVYTATVVFEGKTYTDEKTEEIPAAGHAYELTGWTWEGYTAATATFACANDAAHVLTVAAEITGVRTEASGDADPYVVYTAAVTLEGKEYTDTQTRIIHRYTIRFVNADGKELQSGKVEEGTMPVYEGETPTNEGKGAVRFAGWTPKLEPVTGDATYTAVYASATPEIPFIPIFRVSVGGTEHGSVSVSPEQAAPGGKVSIEAEADEGYALGSVQVRSASGTLIPVTQNDDGSFSFRQTVGGAQVEVSFRRQGGKLFADVDEGAYYYDAVLWAAQEGITSGTGENSFSPNEGCTRAQIVTFLWRAFGSPEPESTRNPFADVAESAYYCKAVLWAVETGITNGTGENSFSPDAGCTRAQMATLLWRAFDSPEPESMNNPFADVAENVYYYKAVLWAVETGVTNGTGKDSFSPEESCLRCQIVTFLYRAWEGELRKP